MRLLFAYFHTARQMRMHPQSTFKILNLGKPQELKAITKRTAILIVDGIFLILDS